MGDSLNRDERRHLREARMTAIVVRPGEAPPRERAIVGAAAISLATELTRMAYSVAGQPPRRIPRAEWPVVRRRLHDPE